jgi:hypothetical protein
MLDRVARADGISGIVVIGIIYAILTVIGKIKEAAKTAGGNSAPPTPTPGPSQPQPHAMRPHPARESRPAGVIRDRPRRTQEEGAKLEALLRTLSQATGVPAQGPMGRRSPVSLPSAEEVEERESLEVGANVQDLETEVSRSERKVVDEDDEAEAIAARRVRIAEARDYSPLTGADHLEFDRSIRPVAADKTAVAKPRRSPLQSAMVWREILGPPISLRDRDQL